MNSNTFEVYSWINPGLEIRNTPACGKGIFSINTIKKGETLAIFGGKIIKSKDEYIDTGIQITDDLVITSLDSDEPTNFINHSCNPNAGIKGQIFLVSIEDIHIDDQIVFDYAMCLFSKNSGEYYSFNCKCGSKNCRGKITSNDWKIKELQEKYNGYFEYYLQEKINNSKLYV